MKMSYSGILAVKRETSLGQRSTNFLLSDKFYSNTNSLPVICIFDTNLTTRTTQSFQVTKRTEKYIKLGNLLKLLS